MPAIPRHRWRRSAVAGPGRRGHGKSLKRRINRLADLARMVVEAFDPAIPDAGEVHLIGHSLSGVLVAAVAYIRARKIASVSLIAPAGLGPKIDAATLKGITRASCAKSLSPWLHRLAATPDAISDDYVKAAMKLGRDPALRACQADMAEMLFPDGVQTFDLRAALARLEPPTPILWGRQDRILLHAQVLAFGGDLRFGRQTECRDCVRGWHCGADQELSHWLWFRSRPPVIDRRRCRG